MLNVYMFFLELFSISNLMLSNSYIQTYTYTLLAEVTVFHIFREQEDTDKKEVYCCLLKGFRVHRVGDRSHPYSAMMRREPASLVYMNKQRKIHKSPEQDIKP